MTTEDLEKINKNIEETITKTVNGKIDRIDKKLDNYIKEDNDWKAGVTPTIDEMKRLQGFASVGNSILKFLVLLGAAGSVMYTFIKFVWNR